MGRVERGGEKCTHLPQGTELFLVTWPADNPSAVRRSRIGWMVRAAVSLNDTRDRIHVGRSQNDTQLSAGDSDSPV
ncbi:hypothetical protein XELAEV_18004245mg [Xenopus laevis]|uniref:Uncharacterized protein n=1 Tax=Xenopus laevis TaxID=8355 RepID=A0A974BN70_XENLA|nr:hypothetical protein XELAEV_18004245mg [Xenopus laevis]